MRGGLDLDAATQDREPTYAESVRRYHARRREILKASDRGPPTPGDLWPQATNVGSQLNEGESSP